MNLNIRLADGVDLIESTVPRCGGDGVRFSAPLRRGAAPYADRCERFSGHSHFISLLPFAN